MNRTANTWLPVFPGFYGTVFETGGEEESEMEYYNEKRAEMGLPPLEYHDFDFDYATRNHEIATAACDFIKESLKKFGVVDVRMEKVVSPREYNFTNDSIDCTITYDEDVVQKYLDEHMEAFKEYLKDVYTSRDGFSSYYSTNSDDWKNWSGDKHMVGSVLTFICGSEEVTELAMYYASAEGAPLVVLNINEILPETPEKK